MTEPGNMLFSYAIKMRLLYISSFLVLLNMPMKMHAQQCTFSKKFDPTGMSVQVTSGEGTIYGFQQYTNVRDGEIPKLYRTQQWSGIDWYTSYCRWHIGEGLIFSGANKINDEGDLSVGKRVSSFRQEACVPGNPVETGDGAAVNSTLYHWLFVRTGRAWCREHLLERKITKSTVAMKGSSLGDDTCGFDIDLIGKMYVNLTETMGDPDTIEEALLRSESDSKCYTFVMKKEESGSVATGGADEDCKCPSSSECDGECKLCQVEFADFDGSAFRSSTEVISSDMRGSGLPAEISFEANAVKYKVVFEGLCTGNYYANFELKSQDDISTSSGDDPAEVKPYRTDVERFTVKPTDDGYVEFSYDVPQVKGKYIWLSNLPQAISEAQCSDEAGATVSGLTSISWSLSLGRSGYDKSAGNLWISSETIDADLFVPSKLSLDSNVFEFCEVLYDDTTGVVRQILAPEVLADITTLSKNTYEIRLYSSDGLDRISSSDHLYDVTGIDRMVTYRFEPVGSVDQALRISEIRGESLAYEEYHHDAVTDTWQHVRGSGQVVEELLIDAEIGITSETRTLKDRAGNIAFKQIEKSRMIAGFERMVERIQDPDGDALMTQWVYYENAANDAHNYGRLKTRIDPTGYWETYSYDPNNGRVAKKVSQYLDAVVGSSDELCEVERIIWSTIPDMDGDGAEEYLKTKVLERLGEETSRSHIIDFSKITEETRREYALNPAAANILEFSITDVDQNLLSYEIVHKETFRDRWVINCLAPDVAWNDADNIQVTKRRYYDSGDFEGRMKYELTPANQLTRYDYQIKTDQTTLVSKHQGVPADDTLARVASGITTYETYNEAGNLIKREVFDVETRIGLEYQQALELDEQDRVTQFLYLNGTTTGANYNCCGLAEETDIYGITTTYFYDDLERLDSQVRLGMTTEFDYDAAGRRIKTTLIGTDSSEIIQEQNFYTPSGELDYRLDAMLRKTDFSRSLNSSGQTVRTTLNPDGGTVIKTYHEDGQLASVAGSAANPIKYEYGVVADTHGGRSFKASFVKEIKVAADGSEREFTTTYYDMLGRIYKVEYPSLNASGSVFAYKHYDEKGQLVRETGPDGSRTMLYEYDGLGRTLTRAVDVNTNGVIDFSGVDQVVQNTQSFIEDPDRGFVLRSTTAIWEQDNLDQSTIVKTSDQSLSGLETWVTAYGQTEHTKTEITGSGDYQTVLTSPDGTISTSTFIAGYLDQVMGAHPDTGTLSQQDFDYDVIGRLDTVNDLRNGLTDYDYYDDGRLELVTTPDPDASLSGTGYDAQTTSYIYSMSPTKGYLQTTTLPDLSVQKTKYTHRGAVEKEWGSSTYPVEYAYDHAGRLVTMTTWQNFDQASGEGVSGSSTTQWLYNARGLLDEKRYDVIDEDTYTAGPSYSYQNTGLLDTRTSARNIVTTYNFHPQTGILKAVDYSDATSGVINTYDRTGRLRTVHDASGKRSYDYFKGRVESEEWTDGVLDGYRILRGYDERLRPNSFSLLNRTEALYSTGYRYYADSRLHRVLGDESVFEYTYRPDSALLHRTTAYHRGQATFRTEREWDKLNRLQSIDNVAGPALATVQNFVYAYDEMNRRVRVDSAESKYWDYDYDAFGQVKGARKLRSSDDAEIPGYASDYDYDDIGNRITSGPPSATGPGYSAFYSESGASGAPGANALNQYGSRSVARSVGVLGEVDPATTSVTVNGTSATRTDELFYAELDFSDQNTADAPRYETLEAIATIDGAGAGGSNLVASESGDAYLSPNPEDYLYDDDGNLTKDGRWRYTWDAENRLIVMETLAVAYHAGAPRQKIEFTYDTQGRRFSKTVSTWNGATEYWETDENTVFVYDGWNLIAELDARHAPELKLQTTYTWGLDLSGSMQGAGGVGGLLMVEQSGGSTSYPAYDGNGNVMGYYAADTGENLAEFEYGPFGEPIRAAGSKVDEFNFRFSTKYEDAETELLYYGFRYYDPVTGRWLSRDPIWESGGLNLYGMVGNDAVNAWDYLGLQDPRKSNLSRQNMRAALQRAECDELRSILLRAQLAAVVYDPTSSLPAGWSLSVSDIVDNSSGLFSAVYIGPQGEAIIAFRGTTDGADWKANLAQGTGFVADQYDEVHRMSNIAAKYPNAEVVGHSLGGGLASYFGIKNQRTTTTFNSAGLHKYSLDRLHSSRTEAKQYVNAHHVRGEGLSTGQDVVGNPILDYLPTPLPDLGPNAVGRRHGYWPDLKDNDQLSLSLKNIIPGRGLVQLGGLSLELHGMTEMIQAIKRSIGEKCCK